MPEYRAAEAPFRQAEDPRERLERLREMLRAIAEDKGPDHLQGDIERRIKELPEGLERPQKGGVRGAPTLDVGKSSLHARLTSQRGHLAVRRALTRSRRQPMGTCEVCGNEYDMAFEVVAAGARHVFDSFECAIHKMAPICEHCGCRIIGHGVEAEGHFYCGANCARVVGVQAFRA